MTEPEAAQGEMPHSSQGKTLRVGRLSIEMDSGWVTLHNQRLDLTLYEYKVLAHLARRAGQIVAAKELLQQVWGCDGTRRKKLNDTVYRLRQKIEPDAGNPIYLITARGRGYYMPARVEDDPGPMPSAENPP